ncbi:acetyl-CoA carboxylase, biotin carboxyl carrier protein [Solihabitans fulvus]|uniref:Biotin carboxyl carrier protein of acetyl-CoA carboxylase n=1 Tax=Solihabitans fulvus TaxID=1892852 RepID=A0A5B2XHK0_9PSEU|nr:acetyl-CoA carboxylase biotin carboxyl carrier protein subunit [Solihabitans fulvus]KAA2262686.1 acetyl-CoA carboxylase, biotin carboxyl carrier protein [Solihabitans fulvus]
MNDTKQNGLDAVFRRDEELRPSTATQHLWDAVDAAARLSNIAAGQGVQRLSLRLAELHIEVEGATADRAADEPSGPWRPQTPPPTLAAPQPASSAESPPSVTAVTAPLVGVFYRRPMPTAAPFVEVGDAVQVGTQLGIVEAMKMMNAVESPVAGTVVEIGAEDGAVVEYEQALFRIAPSEA